MLRLAFVDGCAPLGRSCSPLLGAHRTVYRHSDGYPSAVIEDLLAFLAWSVRGSDVEYVAANFLEQARDHQVLLRKLDHDSKNGRLGGRDG